MTRGLSAAEVAALERCGVTPSDLKGQDDDD